MEDSLSCLNRPYNFKSFKGRLPQILLCSFLNTTSHLKVRLPYLYRLHRQFLELESIHPFKPTDIWCISDPLYYPLLVLRVRESAHWHVNIPTCEFIYFYCSWNVLRKIICYSIIGFKCHRYNRKVTDEWFCNPSQTE